MDRYAVVGNPVGHSLSPRIHALFARQTGEVLCYDALPAPLDGFERTVTEFRREGGRGLNVTVPFKREAFALAGVLSERSRRAGAVNTLTFRTDNDCEGDNTDGAGLVRDLETNLGIALAGRRLLILGAGGAVRGVLAPLLARAPAAITVANRTAGKAAELARAFAADGPVSGCGLDGLDGHCFDLIVNATSAGLTGELPAIPDHVLAPGGVCYDMLYAAVPTPFMRWGQAHDAGRAVDGLGMLVEQAAESFLIWRGVRPETAPVLAALRPVCR